MADLGADLGADLESFRAEVRDWLEANCPAEMRTPITRDADICWGGRKAKFTSDAQRLWLERMGAKGWTVPEWPAEYGGGGLSKDEAKVLAERNAPHQRALAAVVVRHLDARAGAAQIWQ